MKFSRVKNTYSRKFQINFYIFENHYLSPNFFLKQKHFLTFYLKGFVKDGKKIAFFNIFSSVLFDLFFFIKKNLQLYAYPYEIISQQLAFFEFFNINYILNWYTQSFLYFFFTNFWKPLKQKSKRKHKKQKTQAKFSAVRYFIKKNNRWKITFKIFFLKLLNITGQNLKTKLLKFFMDIILNYKKSWMHLFKIAFYKKILFT